MVHPEASFQPGGGESYPVPVGLQRGACGASEHSRQWAEFSGVRQAAPPSMAGVSSRCRFFDVQPSLPLNLRTPLTQSHELHARPQAPGRVTECFSPAPRL